MTTTTPSVNAYEVRVFDAATGKTLLRFEVTAGSFEAALEKGEPQIEAAALASFDQGGEPEVEISSLA